MGRSLHAYAVTGIASGTGALIVGRLGVVLGHWYVGRFIPNAELEGIVPPLLGAAPGAWLGALLGCWYVLQRERIGAMRGTIVRLGIFVPLVLVAWIVSITRIAGLTTSFPWLIWVGAIVCISLVAVLARWLALRKS